MTNNTSTPQISFPKTGKSPRQLKKVQTVQPTDLMIIHSQGVKDFTIAFQDLVAGLGVLRWYSGIPINLTSPNITHVVHNGTDGSLFLYEALRSDSGFNAPTGTDNSNIYWKIVGAGGGVKDWYSGIPINLTAPNITKVVYGTGGNLFMYQALLNSASTNAPTGLATSNSHWAFVGGGDSIYGYNTVTPTTIAVGGIPANSTFPSNRLLKDVVFSMLNPPIAATVGLGVSPTLFEKGVTQTSSGLSWTVNNGTYTPTTGTLLRNATQIGTPIASGSTTDTFSYNGTTNAIPTYTLIVNFTGLGAVASSATPQCIAPSFSGVGASSLSLETSVASLNSALGNKVLSQNKARSITYTYTQRVFYVYPVALGALTSIKDPNNFETILGWTQTTQSFTLDDGTSESYYIYMTANDGANTGFTYTFS